MMNALHSLTPHALQSILKVLCFVEIGSAHRKTNPNLIKVFREVEGEKNP
jgi:hypothetical protein